MLPSWIDDAERLARAAMRGQGLSAMAAESELHDALNPERVLALLAAAKALDEYVSASDECVTPSGDTDGDVEAMMRFGRADDSARAALSALADT